MQELSCRATNYETPESQKPCEMDRHLSMARRLLVSANGDGVVSCGYSFRQCRTYPKRVPGTPNHRGKLAAKALCPLLRWATTALCEATLVEIRIMDPVFQEFSREQ